MRFIFLSVLLAFPTWLSISLFASDTIYYEIWDISDLDSIGGHSVSTFGDPQVVSTEIGEAVQFDGVGDRLLVDFNPIIDAKEFTVELVFKPDACYPDNTDPRFIHIQDPDDPEEKRVMIELRVDANNQCYMDGYMKTDADNLALRDETLVHPTEVWQHVAITYKDSTLTTYFNGIEELSGTLHFSNTIVNTIGKTSLGARMNDVKFYSGLMKTFKVTHASLEPEDFIFIHDETDSSATETLVIQEEDAMKVFPNPVDQFLSVKLESAWSWTDVEVSILDTSGRIYHRHNPDLQHHDYLNIDTSGFVDGVYFILIQLNDRTDFRRIVVMH